LELNADYGLIQDVPFFKNLKTDDLLCIMRYTSTHSLVYGDYLFSQDDQSDGLYVLLSGKLKVSMFGSRIGDQSIALAEVLPGQYVGEQPQLKISNAKVWDLIKNKDLEANLKNMRTLSEIIRENNKSVAHNQSTAKGIRTRPI